MKLYFKRARGWDVTHWSAIPLNVDGQIYMLFVLVSRTISCNAMVLAGDESCTNVATALVIEEWLHTMQTASKARLCFNFPVKAFSDSLAATCT
jgi:hypothetical protein